MEIYVGLDRYSVSLYEIHVNLNHFAVILNIAPHVIIYVIEIRRMNDLRNNVQFDICNNNINDFLC